MKMLNQVKLTFAGRSVNEGFARAALAAFLVQLDPTVPQLADIKTAVSEAVTNCIIHGYEGKINKIEMKLQYHGNELYVHITDYGIGIADIEKAMEPMYTSKPDHERSGMGFPFMEAFMDGMSPRQWNRCSRQVTPRNEPASALLLCRALWIRSGFRLPRGAEPV